ncbi:hypothetical protein A2W24_03085 [Microgenomates group bacterium RBG_16_45_19]|nr:MAG: hypothetical protein A2W24_03085 [Microgenomates group bacterium RBG_16_45_19]
MAEERAGFQRPQPTRDNWTSRLRQEHGLHTDASMEEVEQKAISLLGSPPTAITGAELVLGRRVDAGDKEITPIIATPGLSPEDRFRLLLLRKSVEDMQEEQGGEKG